ncbi:basic blue protein-like [Malus sylvestris]|uniref:basic blue protein-like n=1 Tax=Malus sylvestris TaxID=3752 RepID=UPI0021AC1205|nr:basic blue protein-like [Malus sylvestris]
MSIKMNKILVIGFGLLVSLLLQCEQVHAVEYTVGDEKGWSPSADLSHWTEGKKFKAGDVLVFKYTDPNLYVVAISNEDSYVHCDLYAGGMDRYHSGNDHVVLKKGINYFIPAGGSYCEKGMKIAVDAK